MGFALQYAGKFYGLSAYPVSYQTIDLIRGTMYLFIIAILMFYSGSLIWKERDANVEQVYDATPHPSWIAYVSKLLAMTGVISILMVLCMLAGITAQALMGYFNFEIGLYLKEFFLIDLSGMICIIILSMLVHTLVNNKYIAFFVFLVLMILNAFIWAPLDIETNMIQFNGTPSYTYSDMNGYGPFVSGKLWFRLYWLLFCGIMSMISIIFWVRGKDEDWKTRWKKAKHSFKGSTKWVTLSFIGLFVLCGSWVYYNTQILNRYTTSKAQLVQQEEYEKKYKKYEDIAQPRVIRAKYDIQLFPKTRDLVVKGTLTLRNKSNEPIDSVHLTLLPEYMNLVVNLEGATIATDDKKAGYRIYRLGNPLAPGDSLTMDFTTEYHSKGFENEVLVTEIVQNGSFFNNADITPQIGYQDDYEISDKSERLKKGLKEKVRMPALERNCTAHCMNTYTSNNSDWVEVETIISTADDQIAIAPGSLLKEWKEGNRRFFHYKLDHASLNFYSFTSARFEVARDKWNGIDVEVYYDKKHPYNVKNMLNSVKKSLAYYTENFGPYYHKQARIIEFPRYASFAQAFPGTMPYSESIGFISRIDKEEDIDMVFYVVAHEMGHQWWAHQVIGAKMQGATLLSETFAQYSALMVMEKEFGKNQMRKFLKYEGDKYLDRRGGESVKEVPSMKVENQGYIHYNKGSMVMYNLKEMIGEDKVNLALRELISKFAYKEPPYPVSYDVVDMFKQQTPDSLQYIITDLFEEMTVFSSKVVSAKSRKLPDGKYEVTMTVQSEKFRSDSLGKETPTLLNDWIDIGVFAKPENGKEEGKIIAIQRKKMTKKEESFSVIAEGEPYEAVVDPLNYQVDRVPKDNKKRLDNTE
jgi:ABC-2 type transport system permease protein